MTRPPDTDGDLEVVVGQGSVLANGSCDGVCRMNGPLLLDFDLRAFRPDAITKQLPGDAVADPLLSMGDLNLDGETDVVAAAGWQVTAITP